MYDCSYSLDSSLFCSIIDQNPVDCRGQIEKMFSKSTDAIGGEKLM